MLAAGIATWRLWRERGGPEPEVVCGHSLGEFSALVAAGALDFAAAIGLVQFRGRAMQEAVPAGTGAMAAILGLEDAQVIEACREAAQGGVVEAVNFNSPGTGGHRRDARARGAGHRGGQAAGRQARHGPSGQRPGAQQPDDRPPRSVWRSGSPRWICGRRASVSSARSMPRRTMTPRTCGASRCANYPAPCAGRTPFGRSPPTASATVIECGPGKVLTALNRRIERGLQYQALEDAASLQAALAAVQA